MAKRDGRSELTNNDRWNEMKHLGKLADTGRFLASLMAFLALALYGLPVAEAEPVPELIAYQGRVYLADGSSNINGTYDIEFRLYDAADEEEGTLLWGEKHTGVPVARGAFSVLLGAGEPTESVEKSAPHGSLAEVFKSDEVYIHVKVGAGQAGGSGRRFVAAPYALRVQNAVKAVHGVPPGTVMPFAGGAAPYGWLPCDGASYSRTDHADLFNVIGTTWGEGGDPPNTFNVPNFGGRIPAGANYANPAEGLGVFAGEEKHTLTSAEMPLHKHEYKDKSFDGAAYIGGPWLWGNHSVADDVEAFSSGTTTSTGGNQSHPNIQPSAVVKYMIKW